MKYFFAFVLSVSFVITPSALVVAEVGGVVTKTTSVNYENLSRSEKIAFLTAEVKRLQTILNELIKNLADKTKTETKTETDLSALKITAVIDYLTQVTSVTVTKSGKEKSITYATTDEKEITTRLTKDLQIKSDILAKALTIRKTNQDELRSILVIVRSDRSLTIRTESFADKQTTVAVSGEEIMAGFLIPMIGSRAVAERVFDGYMTEIRRGKVPNEVFDLLETVIGKSITPALRKSTEFRF